jgi:DNA-binding transcriptional ArsR family regulator
MRKLHNKLIDTVLDEQQLDLAGKILSVMGHPVRLRILDLLTQPGNAEWSVSEVIEALRLPPATASQQLINLKDRGILTNRKQGTFVYYRLDGTQDAVQELLGALVNIVS